MRAIMANRVQQWPLNQQEKDDGGATGWQAKLPYLAHPRVTGIVMDMPIRNSTS
jgi:hypothetical protein